MRSSFCSALMLVALLAGCASSPIGSPTEPGAPGTTPAAPSLPSEQQRLADAFSGTPVVVEMTDDKRLRVAVPLEFSFDAGKSAVKKPLAAVLDRMATGMKPPANISVNVNAPTDPNRPGAKALAQDRAAAVRDYLVARGVSATRFNALGRAPDMVEVLVTTR